MSNIFIPGKQEFDYYYSDTKYVNIQDSIFDTMFDNISRHLAPTNVIKEFIIPKVIESSRGEICVIQSTDSFSYLFVWDINYWKQFQYYLEIYNSIYWFAQSHHSKKELFAHAVSELNYLEGQWSVFLSNYCSSQHPELSKELYENGNHMISSSKHMILHCSYISHALDISKHFVLFHELFHIINDIDNNPYKHNLEIIENGLRDGYYVFGKTPKERKILPVNDIKTAINSFFDETQTSDEDKNEIYNDVFAFLEMLDYYALKKYDEDYARYRLFTEIDIYYNPIKLLKMFDSHFSLIKGITDTILSTQHISLDSSLKLLSKCGQKHKQYMIKRNYLSCQIMNNLVLYEAQKHYNSEEYKDIFARFNYDGNDDFWRISEAIIQPLMNDFNKSVLIPCLYSQHPDR